MDMFAPDFPAAKTGPVPLGDYLIVDSFAGGGGASTGIEMALGRSPDIAINHDGAALAMHRANHPDAVHLSQNIWKHDPIEIVGRRPVGLLWASPDCTHHSKAKGGKPVKRNIRDLANAVVMWAERARPLVICLENVEEFVDWGPLIERDGKLYPDPDRKGVYFKRWVRALRRAGYRVEWRELRACDYGAPTIRKRLILIARRDGEPIVWPEATHGPPDDADEIAGRKRPYRTAADIIDWSLPCPSIFDTSAGIKAKYGLRAVRPLAEATMARIARGIKRYVLDAADPFIVPITHTKNAPVAHSINEPVRTVTTARGGELAFVAPSLVSIAHGDSGGRREYPLGDPVGTVTGSRQHALVAPHLMTMRNAGKPFNEANKPTHTITAGGAGLTLVAAHLQRDFGNSVGSAASDPVGTITAGGGGKAAVVSTFLAQHNGGMTGHDARKPLSTITERGTQQAVVAAHMLSMKGSARRDGPVDAPAATVCAGGTHAALVSAFMIKYYGAGIGSGMAEPCHTATVKERFGLVTVDISGVTHAIVDIGMRMLTARELFRAQGFPDSYIIDPVFEGKRLSKTKQIACCGNSVAPPLAAAIVRANCGFLVKGRAAA